MTDTLLPHQSDFLELIRPWKVLSFIGGMGCLIYGALHYQFADWDIGVSLLMGALTYLCAPWSVNVIYEAVRRRPRMWILRIGASLIVAYCVVDGVYWFYHWAMGNQMLRYENFMVSFPLYFLLGVIWSYRGSTTEFFANLGRMKRDAGSLSRGRGVNKGTGYFSG